MFTSVVKERVTAIYFVALAAMMYYFMEQVITIPYTIPVRQLIVLLIIFSGVVIFLIHPNLARASVALRSALIFALPMLVMITVSLPIWFVNRVTPLELYRESWNYLIYMNQFLAALVSAVFLYLFGKRGIWYNLAGLLAANLGWILSLMVEEGVGPYLRELYRLVVTFAGETGDIIARAEVHELAFCLGVYIVYMLLFYRKDFVFNCLLILSLFCFVSAFKRIAMGSIVISLAAGFALKLLGRKGNDKAVKYTIRITFILVCILLLFYIAFVKADGFHLLEKLGLDTMSRADIYDMVDEYYRFSPAFWGHGMGWLSYQLTRVIELWENAIHNDYLQFYIDLGFWGYLFWIISLTFVRTGYYGRKGRIWDRINTFVIMCYILILSTTDNTMNYQMLYTVSGIVIMGHTFDRQVQEEDRRLLGFIEEPNLIMTDEDMTERWREGRSERRRRKEEKKKSKEKAGRVANGKKGERDCAGI